MTDDRVGRAPLPDVFDPEFLRVFVREAARRGVEVKLPPSTLEKIAAGIEALAAELEEWKEKHGYEAGRADGLEARAVAAKKRNAELEKVLDQIADEEPALDIGPLGRAYTERTRKIAAAALAAGETPQ